MSLYTNGVIFVKKCILAVERLTRFQTRKFPLWNCVFNLFFLFFPLTFYLLVEFAKHLLYVRIVIFCTCCLFSILFLVSVLFLSEIFLFLAVFILFLAPYSSKSIRSIDHFILIIFFLIFLFIQYHTLSTPSFPIFFLQS